jgi:hypothetical protein
MYDPILQTEYYAFRAVFEPHNIRTDRVPGQSDTKLDGLARVFDEKLDAPTYLFARGNEAQPDKEHPVAPAVPQALGGDAWQIAPVSLAPAEHYPGLRDYVQQETLAQANRPNREAAMTAVALAGAQAASRVCRQKAAPPGQTEARAAATRAADAPAAQTRTTKRCTTRAAARRG